MKVKSPAEILEITGERAVMKAEMGIGKSVLLGVMGGAYIALGYLAFIRVTGTMPAEWGSLSNLLGACVFPMGLILVLLGGGELLTGNMLVMTVGVCMRKIMLARLAKNWFVITAANFTGAILVAYFFGHFTGLTEGAFLHKTMASATLKTADPFWVAFVSGIGCNIFVCLAVWLSFSADDYIGKAFAIWFPTMIFVAVGFQHCVANMFIIPAAIFSGQSEIGWTGFALNCIPVFLGNAVGGGGIGVIYFKAYGAKRMIKQDI